MRTRLPALQVDVDGVCQAAADMCEAMAGIDHATALEEVRAPAGPAPKPSCGGESEPSLQMVASAAPAAAPHCPGVHRIRSEGTGHRRANRQRQLRVRLPPPSALGPCTPHPPPRLTLGSRRAVPRQGVVEASHAWAVAERCLLACLPGREVRHIISNLGIDHLEEEELDEMLAEVDPHGTGVINYKDFVKKIFAPISVPAA